MSDTKIIIDSVISGGPTDTNDLMGCYFQNVEGSPDLYSFHVPGGCLLPTKPQFLRFGQNFSFFRGNFFWTISEFKIDENTASGNWHNNDFESSRADDEGTFTAQAGGGVPESATSAGA